ncbi:MAG: hypothetical protein ABW094_12630 [Candidatus Thiodiazotropha sp.]
MYHNDTFLHTLLPVVLIIQACGSGGSNNSSDNGGNDIVNGSAYVDLSWIAPTTRTDGSNLVASTIAGYRIYYGSVDNKLVFLADLQEPRLEEYRVNIPNEGAFYFAISAYDTYGLEGDLSNIVFKNAFIPDN